MSSSKSENLSRYKTHEHGRLKVGLLLTAAALLAENGHAAYAATQLSGCLFSDRIISAVLRFRLPPGAGAAV